MTDVQPMLVVAFDKADFENYCVRHNWTPMTQAKPIYKLEDVQGKIDGTSQPITRTDSAAMNRDWTKIYQYVIQAGGQFL